MNDPAALHRRGLFRYFDGVAETPRFGDTILIQTRLQTACPGANIDRIDTLLDAIVGLAAEDAAEPKLDRLAAMVELAPIVGAGFDLPPFSEADGTGLSIQERVTLLTDYYTALVAETESAAEAEAGVETPPEPA